MPRAIPREEVVALGTSSSSTGTVRDLKDQKIIYNPSAVKPIMIHGTQEPAVIIQGSINYGSAKCSSSSSSSGVRKVLPPIKKSRSSSRDHFSTDDIVDHPHQAADLLPVSPFRQQQQQQHIVRLNRYCSSPTQSSDPNHQKSSKITNNRSQEEAGSASPSSKASLYYSNNSQNHKTLDSINISTGTATSSFSSTQIKEPSRKRSNKQLPSSPSSAVSSHPQPPLLPPKTSHTTSSPTATKSNYNYSDSTATYTTVPSTFVARTSLGNWEMGQTIGKGASGSVKLAFNKITNEKAVIKAIRRPVLESSSTSSSNAVDVVAAAQRILSDPLKLQQELSQVYKLEHYLIREAFISSTLNHVNIARMRSCVLGVNHYYCLYDYLDGQDLVDHLQKFGRMREREARFIFRQILSAVEHSHRNHVVHRDLKFENIRYDTRTGLVTVFDYGLASFHLKDFKAVYEKQLHERGDDQFRRQDPVFNQLMLKTNCGSPCYAAPEIYDGCNYWGPEVDIWSLGVILYGLVVGGLPFFGDTFNQLRDKVKSAQVYYPPYLSNDVKQLISSILVLDPNNRAQMSSIVRHRWINRGYATLPVDYLEFQSIPISLHTLPAHPIMQDEDEDDSELLASSRLGSPLARHHPFWDVWMIENGLLYPPLQSRKVEGGGGGGGINTSNTRISIPVSPKPLISLELSHTLLALDTVDSGQHLITLLKNQNLKSSGSSSSSTDQLLLFENSFNQFLLEREYNMKRMTNLVEIHDHGKISAVGTHTGLTKNASWISSTRSTATTRSGVSDDNIELESVAGHSPPTSNDRYSSKHTQEIGSSSSSPSLVEYQRRKKRGCLALLTNIFISGKKTSKMNVENKSLSPSLSVFYDINKETGNTINNSNNNNSTFSTRRVYIARPSPIAWVRNYFAAFRGQTR